MTPTTTARTRQKNKGLAAMTLGERIQWLLVVRQLTQAEAAKLAGVSQSAISNLVRLPGRQPSSQTLLALAKTLKCDPRFIASGSPSPDISSVQGHHMNDGENIELLTLFEQLDQPKRMQLLVIARVLAGTVTPQTFHRRGDTS
ncbi:helix-turn-helix domain-containing protein [Acidovorax sp. Root402]|uniref:helix-turn-helix domain-containing protein n=1 Tax=Acidovorax sp. Root402 TaxID=1736527 RepID=UPI0009EBBB4F|nr:helix-turn-helix domain-containing protein [Acidovorax sp. Root402]